MSTEIGNNIKKYRKANKMTQKRLAELSEMAEITIRQYESGKYAPKHERLLKIADALGVKPFDLAPELYLPPGGKLTTDFGNGMETHAADNEGVISYWDTRGTNLERIKTNEDQLNDDGIQALADHSDLLVKSGQYKK